MKRLIVCCDGTWQSEDLGQEDAQAQDDAKGWDKKEAIGSNVWKLRNLLADRDQGGVEQHAFYQSGVGTDQGRSRVRRLVSRFGGGSFGWGLNLNIIDAYRWLIREYEPGDELWLFGFSRGAYTARSLAGLIRNCGLLRRAHEDRVDTAMRIYRSRSDHAAPDAPQSRSFRGNYSHPSLKQITFLGVWDTVGALGIPGSFGGLAALVNRKYQFHDVELSSMVKHAYHALAVDEVRGAFRPALWGGKKEPARAKLEARDTVQQVWFVGVHCDVGGGYCESALSDRTLRWMLAKATAQGLALRADEVRSKLPEPSDADGAAAVRATLHDSRWWVHKLGIPGVAARRPIRPGCRQYIHESAARYLRDYADYGEAAVNLRAAMGAGMPCTGDGAA